MARDCRILDTEDIHYPILVERVLYAAHGQSSCVFELQDTSFPVYHCPESGFTVCSSLELWEDPQRMVHGKSDQIPARQPTECATVVKHAVKGSIPSTV